MNSEKPRTVADEQHVYTHPSRVEHWRHLVEIVALTLAAIWALYVFVYQERIKPAYSAASLEVQPVVTHTAMRHGKELVTVEIEQKNIGAVDLQLDASVVNVYGLHYADAFARTVERERHTSTLLNTLPLKPATMVMSSLRLYVPFGGPDENVFFPERDKTPARSFALPAGAYDAIRVEYSVCYQRWDNAKTTKVKIPRLADGAYDLYAVADQEKNDGVSCPSGNTVVAL